MPQKPFFLAISRNADDNDYYDDGESSEEDYYE